MREHVYGNICQTIYSRLAKQIFEKIEHEVTGGPLKGEHATPCLCHIVNMMKYYNNKLAK